MNRMAGNHSRFVPKSGKEGSLLEKAGPTPQKNLNRMPMADGASQRCSSYREAARQGTDNVPFPAFFKIQSTPNLFKEKMFFMSIDHTSHNRVIAGATVPATLPRELQELIRLTEIVNNGFNGIWEAVEALCEIRDRKLYRNVLDERGHSRYKTFDDFGKRILGNNRARLCQYRSIMLNWNTKKSTRGGYEEKH